MNLIRIFFLTGLLAAMGAKDSSAAVKMGAMGDSYTDETSLIDPAATTAAMYNWVEILIHTGRGDFGPLALFPDGDPRKGMGNGSYSYNFALGGASTESLLGSGSPFYYESQCGSPVSPLVWGGFRAEARARNITYGVLEIGGNDILRAASEGRFSLLPPIPTTIQEVQDIYNRYVEALDIAAGGSGNPIKMILTVLPDLGSMPIILWDQAGLSSGQRNNISQHVQLYNSAIRLLAQSRSLPVLDLWDWWETAKNNGVTVGGIPIDVTHRSSGTTLPDLRFLLLNDGLHPTPIGQGLIANRILSILINYYGERGLSLLSDEELLAITGLATSTPVPTDPPTATWTPSPVPTAPPTVTPTGTATPAPTATMPFETPTEAPDTPTPLPTETPTGTPAQEPPVILLAGYWDTLLSRAQGGTLSLMALAQGAEEIHIAFQGQSAGSRLPVYGNPADGLFWLQAIPVAPGTAPRMGLVELLPVSANGPGASWPYLSVDR